jgi:hypothetical protein
MMSEDAPRMRANWKWRFIVLTAAVITTVLFVTQFQPRTTPVTIGFVGYTNNADTPFALFVATNTSSRPFRYWQHIERKSDSGWPTYSGMIPHFDSPYVDVAAHQKFGIHAYPPEGSEPWRVSILGTFRQGRLARLRQSVAVFFYDRNMPRPGQMFDKGMEAFLAQGPEMQSRKQAAIPQRPDAPAR